jgi:hypothetical protein
MKWQEQIEPFGCGHKVRFLSDEAAEPLTYRDALALLHGDETFREQLNDVLADSPFRAFRWENPPLTISTIDRAFEFVLLDAPELDRPATFESFRKQFAGYEQHPVHAFRNLGNDATMVVPNSLGPPNAYCHLAAFVRHSPESQQHALWRLVAEQTLAQLQQMPLWLSTAGAGVPWLHVRLDSTPKYYGYRPYREDG